MHILLKQLSSHRVDQVADIASWPALDLTVVAEIPVHVWECPGFRNDLLQAEGLIVGHCNVIHEVVLQDCTDTCLIEGALTFLAAGDKLLHVVNGGAVVWRDECIRFYGEERPTLTLALELGRECLGVDAHWVGARIDLFYHCDGYGYFKRIQL